MIDTKAVTQSHCQYDLRTIVAEVFAIEQFENTSKEVEMHHVNFNKFDDSAPNVQPISNKLNGQLNNG